MTQICSLDDIPEGQAKGFDVQQENLIVAKKDGEIYVYVNSCPHLSIPLNWEPDDFMDTEGELLRCSTHGALFLVDQGECISGPCSGQSLQAKTFHIKGSQVYLGKIT